jgi:prevent-host-death family protein
MEVSIRDLRNHLSAYLRRVARGEALTVTDRKRPVALLIPSGPAAGGTEAEAGRVLSLPWVSGGEGRPMGLARAARLGPGDLSASDVVVEGRG